jgi:hypothetical protein
VLKYQEQFEHVESERNVLFASLMSIIMDLMWNSMTLVGFICVNIIPELI